ncbi:MAG TPA: diaminopimelate decarboxylase [Nitrospiraceae bacterium]|jgi:diaminopimelate decarboxylase|nr:diaminopimelate decarboxylase [Nitrospiraceae bacterium]
MHLFTYRNGELYAEEVPVKKLAETYGTPLYIYSYTTLLKHFLAYRDAFDRVPHIVCFALKANTNASVLRLIANNGGGADVVSGGELFRALRAKIPSKKIVYAGVGKTEGEIRYALKSRILMFNVESGDELIEIDRLAGTMKVKAPIALRVNPDVDPGTHAYIATGLKKNKFGIPIEEALEYYKLAQNLKNTKIIGIHKHIGSQITKVSPFVDALKKVLLLMDALQGRGIQVRYLDIGGGLGITYKDEDPPLPQDLAKSLIPMLKGRNVTLILEPGRSIVGNAGILVSQVLYLKKRAEKYFVIIDAGMNDLMRPSLYGAYHHIQPLEKTVRKTICADVVGPICESGDFLAKDRELPALKRGEFIAVMSAGAYGYSMSSRYNSRPRSAEVMVKGKEHSLIRRRETCYDLIRGEHIPDFI